MVCSGASDWSSRFPSRPLFCPTTHPCVRVGEVAAFELDRLASFGKIHWYGEGSYQPDLRVCPSHLIVKADEARVVHYWRNYQCTVNSALLCAGAMDGLLGLLSSGNKWVKSIRSIVFCAGWYPRPSAATWASDDRWPVPRVRFRPVGTISV